MCTGMSAKPIASYTREEIEAMSYNELIGLVRETNRTPGGNSTILYVAQRLLIGPRHTILDIGTSTGATALEFSRLTHCSVVGVDINERSLSEARRRADVLGQFRVLFERLDATSLTFPTGAFDVVLFGHGNLRNHQMFWMLSNTGKNSSCRREITKKSLTGNIACVTIQVEKTGGFAQAIIS